ncbi:hypothetical protein ACDX66_00880 [Peribacillus frigoritolerans]
MNQSQLVKILKIKLLSDNTGLQRLLINGKWGIGKSFLWNEFKEIAQQKKLKTIYISLFGIDSIESLKKNIKMEYFLIEAHSNNNITKKISDLVTENVAVKSIIGALSKKYIGLTFDPTQLIPLAISEQYILCFDDLERKSSKLSIVDVLGVIEEIALKANVIILANEEQIDDKDIQQYKDFKEKIVDRSFTLSEISLETIKEIIDNGIIRKFKHKKVLIEMFNTISDKNLRTLQKIISFINEVLQYVDVDERLTKLCYAIIMEDVKGNGKDFEGILETSNGEKKSIYTIYNIPYEVQQVTKYFVEYLKYNSFNIEAVNNFLNPGEIEKDSDSEIYHRLQKAWLFNEDSLIRDFNTIAYNLENENYEFFKNSEKLIFIFYYFHFYNDTLNLNLNFQKLERPAQLLIEKLTKQEMNIDKFLDVSILEIQLVDQKEKMANLLSWYKESLIKSQVESNSIIIQDLYNQKKYKKCSEIIKQYPMVMSETLYFLDDIKLPNCDEQYFNLLIVMVNMGKLVPNLSSKVTQRLVMLRDSTQDKLIRRRIDLLLNN